ncbi:efflux RND transporter periplasmic adaptor subunit [Thioclava sp. GXIMD4216]|uniref:efflux RND transporter periplasmic adaptor subunit n=1 Tax=Thioclava sp. GXIMD4216 TaxID=3131929 RepID=UPI0030D3263D
MFKRLLVAAIALLLLAVIAGGIIGFNLFREKMIGQFFATMQQPAAVVSVTKVVPVTWTPGIEAIGTANAAEGTDLAIEAAGIVREITFAANDTVKKGQLLVQIDDRQEKADLAAAEASLELAQTSLERAQKLNERGVSAVSTLDSAIADATTAQSTVQKLKAALETKRLLAPFDGTIGIPQVDLGEYATVGTPYATLQNDSRMHVDFTLSEQQVRNVSVGQDVEVTSEVGGITKAGKIIGIEPKIDANSRLVGLRAEISNDDRALTPGQFLQVRVILPTQAGVIALPQTVVTSSLYGDSVYVVRDEDKDGETRQIASQVFVKLGRRSGDMVEITEGVKSGDQVVNAGQNRLTPGAPVTIDNSVTLPADPGRDIAPEASK